MFANQSKLRSGAMIIAVIIMAFPSVAIAWDNNARVKATQSSVNENTNAPVIDFARRMGGMSAEEGFEITIDYENNILVTGFVTGDVDFNGDGDYDDEYESGDGFGVTDIFISKFSPENELMWSKRLGGAGYDEGNSIATDSQGTVVVVGNVFGTADLNGDGDYNDPNETPAQQNEYDAVIAAFSSEGKYQWSKRLGGSSWDYAEDVNINYEDEVIVTGGVSYAADLNGDGDYNDHDESEIYGGGYDIFISVFERGGLHQWSRRLGGNSYADIGYSLTSDEGDNIYIAGLITMSADLNGDNDFNDPYEYRTTPGSYDIFMTSFTREGDFRWAKRLGGNWWDEAYGIATDSFNNVYIAGYTNSDSDLNGDGDWNDENESYLLGDMFVSSFDKDGVFRWNERLGSYEYSFGYDLQVDANDQVIISGEVRDAADLNGDEDTNDPYEDVNTHRDAVLISFDKDGAHQWSKRFGGINADYGYSLAIDSSGNIYQAGSIYGDVDFNNDGDYFDTFETAKNSALNDIFIIKFKYLAPDITAPEIKFKHLPPTINRAPAILGGTAYDAESGIEEVEVAYCSQNYRDKFCWHEGGWKRVDMDDVKEYPYWIKTNNSARWETIEKLPSTRDLVTSPSSDDKYYLYARATDIAGNIGYVRTGFKFLGAITPSDDIIETRTVEKTSSKGWGNR